MAPLQACKLLAERLRLDDELSSIRKELKQQFRGVKQRSEFKAAIEQLIGAPVS